MTETSLGWFIVGICLAGFVTLWFSVSYRELCAKRKSLAVITEQVWLHRTQCAGFYHSGTSDEPNTSVFQ